MDITKKEIRETVVFPLMLEILLNGVGVLVPRLFISYIEFLPPLSFFCSTLIIYILIDAIIYICLSNWQKKNYFTFLRLFNNLLIILMAFFLFMIIFYLFVSQTNNQNEIIRNGICFLGLFVFNLITYVFLSKSIKQKLLLTEKSRNESDRDNFAVTATCIPFYIDKKSNNEIFTYLICNEAYAENKWMFPGGHVYNKEDNHPESVAKSTAETEAGLEVEIINIYSKRQEQISTLNENAEIDDSGFVKLILPHYTYLFELNENASCFRQKGHKYHYDNVFVCKVLKEKGEQAAKYPVLKIKLTEISEMKDYTHKEIDNLLTGQVAIRSKKIKKNSDVGSYVSKMLFEAYVDYISYINNKSNNTMSKG